MANHSWLTKRPIAHRGLHQSNQGIWENTRSSFAAAIAGDFAIELDLQISADGVPVVFHDHTIDRLTNGSCSVRSLTAAELGKLAIMDSGDRIEMLPETLAFVAGRVGLVLELKSIDGQDRGFADAVARALDNYKGPAAVMSFNHRLVTQLSQLIVERPVGLTALGSDQEFDKHMDFINQVAVDFISYRVDDIPCQFVRVARDERNLPVITWTVRDPKQIAITGKYANQMTFEGFDPNAA